MTASSTTRYSKVTSALHWIGALLIIALIVVGQMMENMDGVERLQLLDLHRKAGLATGIIFLLRLVFFFVHARPAADPSWPGWQAMAAKALHAVLYLLPILMVISGMASMMIFGLDAYIGTDDIAGYITASETVPSLTVHSIGAKLLVASVVLHVLAALYHQFVQKDGVMKRISLLS